MTQLAASEVRRFLLEHLSLMIAANGLNPAELAGDFDLLKAGVIDSLGVLEMISAIEHRFKITVDFEPLDPAELTVLDKFCTFVAENAVQSESSS
jgi:acyl carrier protein